MKAYEESSGFFVCLAFPMWSSNVGKPVLSSVSGILRKMMVLPGSNFWNVSLNCLIHKDVCRKCFGVWDQIFQILIWCSYIFGAGSMTGKWKIICRSVIKVDGARWPTSFCSMGGSRRAAAINMRCGGSWELADACVWRMYIQLCTLHNCVLLCLLRAVEISLCVNGV